MLCTIVPIVYFFSDCMAGLGLLCVGLAMNVYLCILNQLTLVDEVSDIDWLCVIPFGVRLMLMVGRLSYTNILGFQEPMSFLRVPKTLDS